MVGLAETGLLAAVLAGNYDCAIEHQVAISAEGANNQQVMFPESDRENWRFSVHVPEGRGPTVTIDWPANPIQIAGRHPSIDIAPGQVALAAISAGPCMFTETACIALVELSARDDGNAAFSILPAGSSREANGTRTLLHVAFVGTCRRHNGTAQ